MDHIHPLYTAVETDVLAALAVEWQHNSRREEIEIQSNLDKLRALWRDELSKSGAMAPDPTAMKVNLEEEIRLKRKAEREAAKNAEKKVRRAEAKAAAASVPERLPVPLPYPSMASLASAGRPAQSPALALAAHRPLVGPHIGAHMGMGGMIRPANKGINLLANVFENPPQDETSRNQTNKQTENNQATAAASSSSSSSGAPASSSGTVTLPQSDGGGDDSDDGFADGGRNEFTDEIEKIIENENASFSGGADENLPASSSSPAPTAAEIAHRQAHPELYSEELTAADDDQEDEEAERQLRECDDVILCQYEKVEYQKGKWKLHLRDGMMNIEGRDYVFSKGTGELEW